MTRILSSFKSLIVTALLSVFSLGAQAEDVTLSSSTVGNTDCTSGWWSAFSDNVNIPTGKALTLSFTNNTSEYSSEWGLYMNWLLVTSSVKLGGEGYGTATEYFVLRPDKYGWGSRADYPYTSANLAINYVDVLTEWWNTQTWNTAMQGAKTTIEIQRLTNGRVYVTATMVTAANQTLTESYWQDCSADGDFYAFLTVQNSYISDLKATLSDATIGVKTLASISVASAENVTHYFAPDADTAPFIKASAIVTAKYTDDTEETVSNSQVTFSETIAKDGKFSATYGGFTANGVANVSSQTCSVIGATDFTSGFGASKTSSVQVKKGQTVAQTFQLRSDGEGNWHGPITLLHSASASEYGAFRLDNCAFLGTTWSPNAMFGTLSSNWDWGNFLYNLDGSMVTLSVTNNGETIDVKYDVVDGAGVSHYQYFTGVLASNVSDQVDEDDVYVYLTCENAYLLFEQSQTTAISNVKSGSNIKVLGNEIKVEGADNFEVYSLNGAKVNPANLAHGIYIVRTPNATQKVVIK